MSENSDKTVNVIINHGDGSTNSVPVHPDQIQYDESGVNPVGVVLPTMEKGDEFGGVEQIPAPTPGK